MANLKVVDADVLEANLISVADSIRAKTGGEEKLAFPSGFVSALDTIQSADSALAEVEYALSNGYSNYSDYFYSLSQMTEVPMGILRHTSNATNFENMFYGSRCKTIPRLDTSAGTNFNGMFQMSTIETIEGINITKATAVGRMFYLCDDLENLTFNGYIKISELNLSYSRLTHDSLMSVINALYDYASEGKSGTFRLTLGSTNLAKLTDAEKAIATQKGWTLL